MKSIKRRGRSAMKYAISLIFSIFLLSCTQGTYPDKPEEVYSEYHTAIAAGDIERAVNYISAKERDRIRTEYAEGTRIIPESPEMYALTTWELKDVTINDNDATIIIKVRTPDVGKMIGLAIANTLVTEFHNLIANVDISSEMPETLKDAEYEYNYNELPFTEYDKKISFLREDNKWKIFFNLERQERIEELIFNASGLYKQGKLKEAKEVLDKVAEMDPDNAMYKFLLERIEKDETRE